MTSKLDRFHLLAALLYGMLGLGLGIYMAASHDHGMAVAHAHLLLVGFLLSFAYAVIGRLWLTNHSAMLRGLQFAGHHIGVVGLISGLVLLYSGGVSRSTLEPLLAASSILLLIALVLMSVVVAQARSVRACDLEPARSA